jgi:hypothetical protein
MTPWKKQAKAHGGARGAPEGNRAHRAIQLVFSVSVRSLGRAKFFQLSEDSPEDCGTARVEIGTFRTLAAQRSPALVPR